MSRDKQIEEMENVLYGLNEKFSEYCGGKSCADCEFDKYERCSFRYKAETLYNAGYRKASDVAREIFEEIAKASGEWGCYSISSTKWGYLTSDVHKTIADLKKKYESENNNG